VQLLYEVTNNGTLFTYMFHLLSLSQLNFYQHIFLYSTKQNTNNAYIPHPLQIFFLQLLYQYPKLLRMVFILRSLEYFNLESYSRIF